MIVAIIAILVVLILLVEIGVFVFTLLLIISNISILKSKKTRSGKEVLPPCDETIRMVTEDTKEAACELAKDTLEIIDDARIIAVEVTKGVTTEIAEGCPSENE